jgi:PIN domain nuclease of toxin-antitoxin system
MASVAVDTHALVWYVEGSAEFSAPVPAALQAESKCSLEPEWAETCLFENPS